MKLRNSVLNSIQKNKTWKDKFNRRDVLKTTKHCSEKLKEMYIWREICEKLFIGWKTQCYYEDNSHQYDL